MRLHCMSDVSEMVACLCHVNSLVERLLCGCKQTLNVFRHLTDTKGIAGISVISLIDSATIDGNYVAFLKDSPCIWNAVDNHIIHRRTDTRRKGTASKRIRETLECRLGTMIPDKLLSYLVQLKGGNPRSDMFSQFAKCPPYKGVRLAH